MNASCLQAYTIPGVDSMQADITTPLHLAPLHLAPVGAKAVDLAFDGGRLSSDAGLVLLKDPDEQLGLTHSLAAVLSDPRDPRRVHFTSHDLLKQRVFQLPRAMKMPTTPTPCATIPSSNCCSIACRKLVPPWLHNRRYRGLKTASRALNSTAWRWCWWINVSPPMSAHPSSSCSTSMTRRIP